MKAKKATRIGIGIILLIALAAAAVVITTKLQKQKEKEALKQAFRIENMVGRWEIEEEDCSILIYMDNQDGYRLRSDLFFDPSTGEGMFDVPARNIIEGSLTGSFDLNSADSLELLAFKRLNKDNTRFTVTLEYWNRNDLITGDESIKYSNVTLIKDTDYDKLKGSSSATDYSDDAIDQVLKLVGDACTRYQGSQLGVKYIEWGDKNADAVFFCQPVNGRGYIEGTALVSPVSNGSFGQGEAAVQFEIDPCTKPMTIHRLTAGSTFIIHQYKWER